MDTEVLNQALSVDEQVSQVEQFLSFEGEISSITQKTLLQSIAHAQGEMVKVDIDKIRIKEGFNPRIKNADYYAHIRSLADSILSEGFYVSKPLAGMGGYENKRPVIYITDGGCRFEALKLAISEGAEIDWVPVVLKSTATTLEDLTVALVRSNEGKQFSPIELSVAIKRLSNYGWGIPKIAAKLGFTTTYIQQLLQIAGAPVLIRQMIESGEVPVAVALSTMNSHGDDASAVLKDVVETAKANGSKGITKRNLPEQIYKRAVTKVTPSMISAIERVKSDPSYGALSDDLRGMLEDIIAKLDAAKPVQVADADKTEAQ